MKTPVQQLTKRIRTVCRQHYKQAMTERRRGYSVAVWDGIVAAEIKSALITILRECGASEPPANAEFVEWVEAVTRDRLEAAEDGDTEAAEEEPDQHMKPKGD